MMRTVAHIYESRLKAWEAFQHSTMPGLRRQPQMEIIDGDNRHLFVPKMNIKFLSGQRLQEVDLQCELDHDRRNYLQGLIRFERRA